MTVLRPQTSVCIPVCHIKKNLVSFLQRKRRKSQAHSLISSCLLPEQCLWSTCSHLNRFAIFEKSGFCGCGNCNNTDMRFGFYPSNNSPPKSEVQQKHLCMLHVSVFAPDCQFFFHKNEFIAIFYNQTLAVNKFGYEIYNQTLVVKQCN